MHITWYFIHKKKMKNDIYLKQFFLGSRLLRFINSRARVFFRHFPGTQCKNLHFLFVCDAAAVVTQTTLNVYGFDIFVMWKVINMFDVQALPVCRRTEKNVPQFNENMYILCKSSSTYILLAENLFEFSFWSFNKLFLLWFS